MKSLIRNVAAGVLAAATMLGIAGLGATTANAQEANGSIKVSSTNAEFAGKEIKAYQMFSYDLDAVNAGTADNGGFTLNSEWNQFFISNKTEFNLGDDTTVDNVAQRAYDYVSGLKDGKTQVVPFAKKASDWAKTQTGLTIKTENAAKIAVDGKYTATFTDLAYGSYLVSPKAGSTDTSDKRGTDAILLNVLNSTAVEQDLKSTYPTIQKTVKNGTDDKKHNSVEIGDTVDFKLASTVPDMTEYTNGYTFKFTDTLSKGLTLNGTAEGGTFAPTVKIGDTTLTKDLDYTATYTTDSDTGKTALEVNMMNFKNLHQNDAGKAITVEYSATLNKDAEVGSTGNQNDAKIEYSNDPASNGTGTTKEDKTYTYTFNFDIEKVNAVDHNDKLKGAQFELQRENGTKINLVKVSDGVFRPAKRTETVADDKTVVTDNNGKLQFTGLKEGTYKVKEIKAPTGYNLLKDPITVTISATYDENTGILESWKVNNANAQGTTVPVITVENNKGVTLPETGGMGTVLFTVFGVAIVALGATWYVKSNRKSRHAA